MVSSFEVWDTISIIIGWVYFVAWSVSFYPQVYENFVRKRYQFYLCCFLPNSVVGLSFDFLAYNLLGHSCYLVFNAAMYWNPYVRRVYMIKNPTAKGIPVELNDVVFSLHAVALTLITIFQCIIYEVYMSFCIL